MCRMLECILDLVHSSPAVQHSVRISCSASRWFQAWSNDTSTTILAGTALGKSTVLKPVVAAAAVSIGYAQRFT